MKWIRLPAFVPKFICSFASSLLNDVYTTISDYMWFFSLAPMCMCECVCECVSFSVFIDLLFKRKTDRFFSLSPVIIHTQYPFCLILIWFYQYRIEIFYLNNPQPFWLIRLWNPHRAVHSLGKISNEQKPRKKIETRFRKKSTKRFNEQKHLFISINSDSKLPHTHTIQI